MWGVRGVPLDDVEAINNVAVVTVETTVAWVSCTHAYGVFATYNAIVMPFVYVFTHVLYLYIRHGFKVYKSLCVCSIYSSTNLYTLIWFPLDVLFIYLFILFILLLFIISLLSHCFTNSPRLKKAPPTNAGTTVRGLNKSSEILKA